jgi:hypothetical protein
VIAPRPSSLPWYGETRQVGIGTLQRRLEVQGFESRSLRQLGTINASVWGSAFHMSELAMRGTASDRCKPTNAAHFDGFRHAG